MKLIKKVKGVWNIATKNQKTFAKILVAYLIIGVVDVILVTSGKVSIDISNLVWLLVSVLVWLMYAWLMLTDKE